MPEMDGIETMREIRKMPRAEEPADHRGDGQGDEGRPREVHRGRAPGTTCPSRSIPSRCWPCCGRGCTAEVSSAWRRPTTPASSGATTMADDKVEHPDRRRPAREAARLPGRSWRSWAEPGHAPAPGAEALRQVLRARLRRHPARRQHAGHGRLRDGRADPAATRARRTRRSSSSPPSPTRCRRPRATRSARSTTSSRRSCPEVLRSKVQVFVDLFR